MKEQKTHKLLSISGVVLNGRFLNGQKKLKSYQNSLEIMGETKILRLKSKQFLVGWQLVIEKLQLDGLAQIPSAI